MSLSSFVSKEFASLSINGQSLNVSDDGQLLIGGSAGNRAFTVTSSPYTIASLKSGSDIYTTASTGTIALPAPFLGAQFNITFAHTAGAVIVSNGANIWGNYTLGTAGAISLTAAKTSFSAASSIIKLGDYVRVKSDGSKYFIEGSSGSTSGYLFA